MSSAPPPSDYSAFGFRIRSDLPLPELFAATGEDEPDVRIRLAAVPSSELQLAGLHEINSGSLLVVPDVARYWVGGGREILVEPDPGAPTENVRLYLLGSVLGLLIHQRGLLPLHANAVEIAGKAVAFMGATGEGKSTLAAWFHDRGHRIVADDVCVVRFDAGRPRAIPGLPRLRLWKEALDASGRDAANFSRSFAGDDSYDKFDVPIAAASAVEADLPLVAVYLLARGERLEIEAMNGLDAAEAVMANTYRGGYLAQAGSARLHWQACLDLVREAPIFECRRVWDRGRLDEQSAAILAHAEAVCGA